MGFIEVVSKNDVSVAAEIWVDFADIQGSDNADRIVEVEGALIDGSKIVVGKDMMLALFAGEKMIDCATGPGAYMYHRAFPCGEYSQDTAPYAKEIRAVKPEAFVTSAEELTDIRLMCINRKGTVRIPFTFDEALYHDSRYNLDLILQGSGWMMAGPSSPLFCYALADYSKDRLSGQLEPSFEEAEKKELAAEAEAAFESVLIQLRDEDLDYNQIPFRTRELVTLINNELQESWGRKRGIAITDLEFTAIYPNEASVQAMVKVRKSGKFVQQEGVVQPGTAAPNTRHAAQSQEVSPQSAQTLPETALSPLEEYIRANFGDKKVQAVKYYNDKMGTGLAEAKAAIEKIFS